MNFERKEREKCLLIRCEIQQNSGKKTEDENAEVIYFYTKKASVLKFEAFASCLIFLKSCSYLHMMSTHYKVKIKLYHIYKNKNEWKSITESLVAPKTQVTQKQTSKQLNVQGNS